MKKNLINFLSLIWFLYSCTGKINNNKYPYQDAGSPVEKRVTDLIGRMTIDEKIQSTRYVLGREVANMNGHELLRIQKKKLNR